MECRLCREAVVIGIDIFYRERNLEMSLEYKVLKVQSLAIFLDGFWPLGLSEVNPLCGHLDGRWL